MASEITFEPEYRWLGALFVITALVTAAALAVGAIIGVPTGSILVEYASTIWKFAPLTIVITITITLIQSAIKRSLSPLEDLRQFVGLRLGTPGAAASTIVPILLMPLLMSAFGTLKQVIPAISPFSWDDSLAEFGRVMFGGTRPWHFTHRLFGSPIATLVIDRIYTAWVPLLFASILGFAIAAPPSLRARFFLCFAVSFVLLGVVAAYLFSSAGPCYASAVGSSAGPDFDLLMARLRAIDNSGYQLGALHWQEQLWAAHVQHKYGFAMGISAMPSMHNAISFLYVLALARAAMPVRAVTWLFAATILIGSVHLGWHYLADGLFAWAGMGAIWWGAGVYLRRIGYASSAEAAAARVPQPTAPAAGVTL